MHRMLPRERRKYTNESSCVFFFLRRVFYTLQNICAITSYIDIMINRSMIHWITRIWRGMWNEKKILLNCHYFSSRFYVILFSFLLENMMIHHCEPIFNVCHIDQNFDHSEVFFLLKQRKKAFALVVFMWILTINSSTCIDDSIEYRLKFNQLFVYISYFE